MRSCASRTRSITRSPRSVRDRPCSPAALSTHSAISASCAAAWHGTARLGACRCPARHEAQGRCGLPHGIRRASHATPHGIRREVARMSCCTLHEVAHVSCTLRCMPTCHVAGEPRRTAMSFGCAPWRLCRECLGSVRAGLKLERVMDKHLTLYAQARRTSARVCGCLRARVPVGARARAGTFVCLCVLQSTRARRARLCVSMGGGCSRVLGCHKVPHAGRLCR
jgi:hypothetical protein